MSFNLPYPVSDILASPLAVTITVAAASVRAILSKPVDEEMSMVNYTLIAEVASSVTAAIDSAVVVGGTTYYVVRIEDDLLGFRKLYLSEYKSQVA